MAKKYKVTKENSIAYETEKLAQFVEKNIKAGYVPCLRYCSAEELAKFEECESNCRRLAKEIAIAHKKGDETTEKSLTEELVKEKAFMQTDLGVDGAKYKDAEQDNGNLIEGERYIFLFMLNNKDPRVLRTNIHKALESIKYERQVTEQLGNNSYPEYYSSIFFIKEGQFSIQHGRYWPHANDLSIDLKEYHINTKDFDPLSFQPSSQVHDMKMLADFLVQTDRSDYDIANLAEENREFMDMARTLRELGDAVPDIEDEPTPKKPGLTDYYKKYKDIIPEEDIETFWGLLGMINGGGYGPESIAELDEYYKGQGNPKLHAAFKDIVISNITNNNDKCGQGDNGGQGDQGGRGGQGDDEE